MYTCFDVLCPIHGILQVGPKEGDTADRQKYYQGIKFYDPEIIGDTPETVELKGVRNLVQACSRSLGQQKGLRVFDANGQVRIHFPGLSLQ